MPLLNYTTKIEAAKTAAEIIGILAKLKAKGTTIDFGADQQPTALTFMLATEAGDLRFRLPARVDGVHEALVRDWERGRLTAGQATRLQARRVAWRILKDWVEAQVAVIESGLVRSEEVFLPYALTPGDVTFFEAFVEQQKALPAGGR